MASQQRNNRRAGFRGVFGLLAALLLTGILPPNAAMADIKVTVAGPGGQAIQALPDAGGVFDLNLPLTPNAVNHITVTAEDALGNQASRDLEVTQVSLNQIVISRITSERLSVEEVEQLVVDGVIDLEDPENYNVSTFDIVLTIDKRPVPVSVPIAIPVNVKDATGFETYRMPTLNDNPGKPKNPPVQVVVFEQHVSPSVPGDPTPPPIPGVIIIEGNIKSLKEFFNVRLLLLNTSGIFTLSDVMAEIELPEGMLSNILPADGINSFGDILPGENGEPGQKEQEFIIRGDGIGIHDVSVSFAGTVTGPGITAPIAFNGSAVTEVEVKGPPTFLVAVTHPEEVTEGETYELMVDITNTGQLTAMYASLELSITADAEVETCAFREDAGQTECEFTNGPEIRPFGHIEPGETVRETFTVLPSVSGGISSCVAASDQNITLNVYIGTMGCMVGQFPPATKTDDGIPTVSVVPTANATGVSEVAPVVAIFSERMNTGSIVTGTGGTFNVFDSAGELVPGIIRFESLNTNTVKEKTVAIWQVNDGSTTSFASKAKYSVVLTTDITDSEGHGLANRWESTFTTTDSGINDTTAPTLSLSVAAPVYPNAVLPGEMVKINTYAADAGSGISRVELRIKDMDVTGALFTLVGQKTVYEGDRPPFIFTIDSGALVPGHTYQAKAVAYDGMGNAQDATLALMLLSSAAPPVVTLPVDPAAQVLQGISITLKPAISAGVRKVGFFLDDSSTAYKTVSLAPFQASLTTRELALGAHSITVRATDGLGQQGEGVYQFDLVENVNEPVVGFSGVTDGAVYTVGEAILINGTAEDPVGIRSISYYLDSTATEPLYTGFAPISLSTTNLTTGNHTVYIQAVNQLGIASDAGDPEAAFDFSIVEPPAGEPPAAPALSSVGYPLSGMVNVAGNTVPAARIEITNTDLGLTISGQADGIGSFAVQVPAQAGQRLLIVAYDLSASAEPSQATVAIVPAAPVLSHIIASPLTMTFTTSNQSINITVTGHYQDGSSAVLTSEATFNSTAPAIASVSDNGRVTGLSYGEAYINISVNGFSAQVAATSNIITLTGISVAPAAISLVAIDQTAVLSVSGLYSDATSEPIVSGISFVTGDPSIAGVDSTGTVTARSSGTTQVHVSYPGVPPVSVPIVVNTAQDPEPEVSIVSPISGTMVQRTETAAIVVQAQDDIGGITRIHLEATGATSQTDIIQVAPAALSVTRTFYMTVDQNAVIGETIDIVITAEDTSGNLSIPEMVTLVVDDSTAPELAITQPAQQTPYNYGDTVSVRVAANDIGGISQIHFETTGALTLSEDRFFSSPASAQADFAFTIPYGLTRSDIAITAYAVDDQGNEGDAIAVDIIVTDADITAPETEATAVADPENSSTSVVTYEVTSGLADLDHVLLYFRRNGIGTFNRYTGPLGDESGEYYPENGNEGTIVFDSTRMGGDGDYEFFTVGVDVAANHEAVPVDDDGNALADVTALFNSGTEWTPITVSTIITADNLSYDNQNLRILGSDVVVILDGSHSFHNVEILDGAVLRHSETTTNDIYMLDIKAWTVSVDAESRIDSTGSGYIGGTGHNESGRTIDNAYGSTHHSGGSYGGIGGAYDGAPGPVYGDLTNPIVPGSGGGADGYTDGGDGGGVILIDAVNIAVDGIIQSNGAESAGGSAGDGSGGSVHITCRSLSGTGLIAADAGGSNSGVGVGGGGGRVAIFYLDISTMDINKVTAIGSIGYYGAGSNGTVYLFQAGDTNGEIVITGQNSINAWTQLSIPEGHVFSNVTLSNNAHVLADEGIVITGRLLLTGGSVLSHGNVNEEGLVIEASVVQVDEGSRIDVSGRGYAGGTGHNESGRTLNNAYGSTHHAGGSYGGRGSIYTTVASGLCYGDPRQPDELGSGGGADGYTDGGSGGGRVTIQASEAVMVNGAILANGGESSGGSAGDGSGGAIRITTGRLAGTGAISANGGGSGSGVAGGGGRVAVYCDYVDATDNFRDLYDITAFGGRGYYVDQAASAGTVFIQYTGQDWGDLYIDDNFATATASRSTELSHIGFGVNTGVTENTLTTDSLVALLASGLEGLRINPDITQTETFRILTNTSIGITVVTPNENGVEFSAVAQLGDTYAGAYRFDNVTFRRGGNLKMGDLLVVEETMLIDEYGMLTHFDADTAFVSRLDLSVDNLIVETSGRIDASGRGYVGGTGHNESGRMLDNIYGSTHHAGGSYGGLGGSYSEGVSGVTCGSETDPVDLGGGGGADGYTDGGDGGGRIFIMAGEMTVDGVIRANGNNGAGGSAGNGSGGTVSISTGYLAGGGTIEANGGGTGSGVGGGGGRIAIRYNKSMTFLENDIQTLGGHGYYGTAGGNGTIFIKRPGQTYGDLIVDGLGRSTTADQTILHDGYTYDNVIIRNNAHVLADEGIVITGRLLLTGGSVLSHGNVNEEGLVIEASVVQVDEGSRIDVSGRGYAGGTGHNESGRTLNNAYGSTHHAGGSYGGRGSIYTTVASGLCYGDPRQPDELGSGGGADGYTDGGSGGGRVTIQASEAVMVNGAILANGGESSGGSAGDGSGGAIRITTGRLAGTGAISANGGGSGSGVAGGGGRVAVYCDYVDATDNFRDLYDITAFGGRGYYVDQAASAGTVFIQYTGQDWGDLYIDDNFATATASRSTELSHIGFGVNTGVTENTLTTDSLVALLASGLEGLRINPDITQTETFRILTNTSIGITVVTPNENGVEFSAVAQLGDTYAGAYRFDNVTFRRGGNLKMGDLLVVEETMLIDEYGMLTHFDADTAFVSRLDLSVDNLIVETSGRIDASGRGYVGGTGHNESGRMLDNIYGSTHHAGGSYGGLGGSYSEGVSGVTYGSETDPVDLGGGGGADGYTDGGDGGGRIFIMAGEMTVDGVIRANGNNGAGGSAGNGSGGTVSISTGYLAGGGTIEANGGGTGSGVGGGGGRMAIRYSHTMTIPQERLQVFGGIGYYGSPGGNGTLYLEH